MKAPASVPRAVARKAMEERLALLIENAPDDSRFGEGTMHSHGVQSAMCAPLLGSRGCLGIIYLDNLSLIHSFSDEDLDFLSAFAGIVGGGDREQPAGRAGAARGGGAVELPALLRARPGRPDRRPGGARCSSAARSARVAVLFSDIRGFTALSERLAPEEIGEPAQRLLHRDGGDRLPARRHARQVHRRRADGALGRAARPPRRRRPRGGGGGGDAARPGAAQRRLGGARAAAAGGGDRPLGRRGLRRQHRQRAAAGVHGHRRRREHRLPPLRRGARPARS